MKDLVLVVLLNYNQNDYTLNCIESLLDSDYDNLKILLIDNASITENALELERDLPKDERLIFKRLYDNIGYAKGTNYGLKEGMNLKPKYFLIMNNDTIIDKSAISELVKTSKKFNDMARVTGKVYHYDDPNRIQFISFEYTKRNKLSYKRVGLDKIDKGQFDDMEELEMMDDVYVLHPASLYESIGGYSPYLWVNGVNIDISLRAIKEGYKLIFTPNAKLWHKGGVSLGGRNMNPKLAFWNIQSKLILRYLHLKKINFISTYFKVLFNDVLRTSIKSIYLKLFKGVDTTKYAKAKIGAFLYFNKWMIRKNHNKGYNPY